MVDSMVASESVINRQPEAVVGSFPPMKRRHDELSRYNQVRSVASENTTLVERFSDETEIALGQVSNATVYELRAATRCRMAEITSL
jgi:hypothetical protein